MLPALLASTVQLVAGWIINFQLACDIDNDARWNASWIFEESAEESYHTQLNGESEPIVIASPDSDKFTGSIIQMKEARQLVCSWFAAVSAIAIALVLAQKADRHGGLAASRETPKFREGSGAYPYSRSRKYRALLSPFASTLRNQYMKIGYAGF